MPKMLMGKVGVDGGDMPKMGIDGGDTKYRVEMVEISSEGIKKASNL